MSGQDLPRLDLPVALVVLAFFLITAFQTDQLVRQRSALQAVEMAQANGLAQADKLRLQFQLLAEQTTQLANTGDPGAKKVLAQLQAQGVSVRANPGTALPPPAP